MLFKITSGTPPTLTEPDQWSPEFSAFLKTALARAPSSRPTADELRNHPFCRDCKQSTPMLQLLQEASDVSSTCPAGTGINARSQRRRPRGQQGPYRGSWPRTRGRRLQCRLPSHACRVCSTCTSRPHTARSRGRRGAAAQAAQAQVLAAASSGWTCVVGMTVHGKNSTATPFSSSTRAAAALTSSTRACRLGPR